MDEFSCKPHGRRLESSLSFSKMNLASWREKDHKSPSLAFRDSDEYLQTEATSRKVAIEGFMRFRILFSSQMFDYLEVRVSAAL